MTLAAEKKIARTVLELSRDSVEPLVRHKGGLAVSLYMPIRFQSKFAAKDFFCTFELWAQVAEQVSVGTHFEQKHVRLLRATAQGVEEVEVHDPPENLFGTFQNESFERQLQFYTASRPDIGACGGQVCVLPPSEFDKGVRMAAVFRY